MRSTLHKTAGIYYSQYEATRATQKPPSAPTQHTPELEDTALSHNVQHSIAAVASGVRQHVVDRWQGQLDAIERHHGQHGRHRHHMTRQATGQCNCECSTRRSSWCENECENIYQLIGPPHAAAVCLALDQRPRPRPVQAKATKSTDQRQLPTRQSPGQQSLGQESNGDQLPDQVPGPRTAARAPKGVTRPLKQTNCKL
ncbi:hypothetical protein ACLKA7_007454 [Drosophila subpalustris]